MEAWWGERGGRASEVGEGSGPRHGPDNGLLRRPM